jgi:hypothetical protein
MYFRRRKYAVSTSKARGVEEKSTLRGGFRVGGSFPNMDYSMLRLTTLWELILMMVALLRVILSPSNSATLQQPKTKSSSLLQTVLAGWWTNKCCQS